MYLYEEKLNVKERFVEMMYVRILDNVKEIVLNLMGDYEGYIRVFICIIAFGMGFDVKRVRIIINFGFYYNLELYV